MEGNVVEKPADRVEDLVHEALGEYAVQSEAYLAAFADRLSPGLGRQPLMLLLRVKRLGPLREGELAVQLRLDAAEVARDVDELVRRGLAVRDESGGTACVRLTDRAVEPLDLAEDERRGRLLDAMEHWSLEDKEAFARLLAKFVQRDDLVVRSVRLFDRR